MAYKDLQLVATKRKYKTRYWVVLPHYTRSDLQPKIRRYKPKIDEKVNGKYMKCWIGYDYVQGSFKTYAEALQHVKRENDFRRSQGWIK